MKKVKISLDIPTIIGGALLAKGVHEVAKKDVTGNWFFDALIDSQKAAVLSVIEKVKDKIVDSIPENTSTDEKEK